MPEMFAIQNVNQGTDGKGNARWERDSHVVCPYCSNDGIVTIDGEFRGIDEPAAPCPMCMAGMLRDYRSSNRPDHRFWATVQNRTDLTFNRGITILHAPCEPCTRRAGTPILIPPGRPCQWCTNRQTTPAPATATLETRPS